MDKRMIDQIALMVSEELQNENSVAATAKGILKNIGDLKEPLRYAASNTSTGTVLSAAAGLFLRIAERQIESHLIENADDIASKIVPDIPFDGDVIEGLMQRAFAKIIKDQADEVAALIVDAVREQFLSVLSSNTELQEALQEAAQLTEADPIDTAEDAIEAMDDAAQDKILNVLLDKIGADDLQEAKGNPVLKALLNLPGGRDLAAMFMASVDRDTPTKLRLLAAFAVLNFISPVDAGTFMGLEFLGPLTALDDLVLLRRMLKKFEKAGLPSEKHHDKLQLAAGEELSADRAAAQELEKAKDLAQGRGRAAVAQDKMRKLEENKFADLKGTFDRFLVKG